MIPNEIARSPESPQLNQEATTLLSELCFRNDDPEEIVDIIFVFSSGVGTEKLSLYIQELLDKKISSKVFVSGGIPPYTDTYHVSSPESELVMSYINTTKYPEVEFFTESNSGNTLENVTEALNVLDFSQFEKVLFIFKTHAAGRGYLTLKKFVSEDTKLIQRTWSHVYEDKFEISKNNWWKTDFGKGRVWGEFLRIKKYGERGDIAYPLEIRQLVQKIEEVLS